MNIKDENASSYVEAIIPQLTVWTGKDIQFEGLNNLFI